jgi:hypothetical protein
MLNVYLLVKVLQLCVLGSKEAFSVLYGYVLQSPEVLSMIHINFWEQIFGNSIPFGKQVSEY